MDTQIKFREKVGYGLGDAASSMFWKLFGSYLLFFYTDIFGLPAAAVGTMFLITRFWDSFVDPVVGILADRTQSRRGKFRPYLLWFAVPFGMAGVLTFTTPGFGMAGKLVYAYITYGVMMMIYSLINVPYASLLGVISDNPKSRTALSSYRMIFAFGGSILALLTIEPLVGWFSPGQRPADGLAGGHGRTGGDSGRIFLLYVRLDTRAGATRTCRTPSVARRPERPVAQPAVVILLGAGTAALIFNSTATGPPSIISNTMSRPQPPPKAPARRFRSPRSSSYWGRPPTSRASCS